MPQQIPNSPSPANPTVPFPMILDGVIYERAGVGVDGNCGYALLGPNLQEGESEFVEIRKHADPAINAERHAWVHALHNLRKRLNLPQLSYFLVA